MRRRAAILLALAAVAGLLLLEKERGRAREPQPRRAAAEDSGDARLASAPAEEEAAASAADAIGGTVRDEGGVPLPGARVRLFPDRADGKADAWRDRAPDAPSPRATATTDDAGRFALKAGRDASWTVIADAPGYVPAVALVPPGRDTVHFLLVRGATQQLRVVDEDKRPLAEAELLVFQGAQTLRTSAKADAAGRIEVAFAPRDLLLVRAPGFTWELLEPPLAEPEIVLDREYRVGGVVLTAAGEPAKGVPVTIERYLWFERQLTSDEGRFLFPGLGEAEVELTIDLPDGDSFRETAPAGDERLRIVLPTVRIEGTVLLPDGSPAAGAEVTSPSSTKCDERGRFALGGLVAGETVVRAEMGNELSGYTDVTVPAAGLTGIRVVLKPVEVVRSFVAVRVAGPAGVEFDKAKIEATLVDGRDCSDRWDSRADGRGVLVTREPPGTELALSASAAGPDRPNPAIWTARARAVTSASPAGAETELTLGPPVEITVVCRAADGSALPPALKSKVSVEPSSKPLPADTPHRHRFRVPRLPEEIRVTGSARGYLYHPVSWSPPDSGGEIEIRLERGARVTGRFASEVDWYMGGVDLNDDGSFEFLATPGSTEFLWAGKGPVPGVFLAIQIPLHGDLDLGEVPLEPPFLAKGLVVDERGDPVGGAQVSASGDYGSWKVTTRGDGSFTIPLPRTDLFQVEVEKGPLAADPVPATTFLKGPQKIRLAPAR